MAVIPSITSRVSIAWPPNPTSEPTSTLVLSSPTGRFVDVRICLDPNGKHGLGELDWAFAGSAIYTTDRDGARRGTWTHEVDSKYEDSTFSDTGILSDLENGDELERGIMKDVDGIERDYEEIWRGHEVVPNIWKVSESHKNMNVEGILGGQGLAIRVGRWAQGIMKGECGTLSVFRAQWVEGVWRIEFQVGDETVVKMLLNSVTDREGVTSQ